MMTWIREIEIGLDGCFSRMKLKVAYDWDNWMLVSGQYMRIISQEVRAWKWDGRQNKLSYLIIGTTKLHASCSSSFIHSRNNGIYVL
jgi:hypothetical protein